MTTYFLNAGSTTQTGLIPNEGYHSLTGLIAGIPGLANDDTIDVVDNGIIMEPELGNFLLVPFSLTIQSWPSNINKPTWHIPLRDDTELVSIAFDRSGSPGSVYLYQLKITGAGYYTNVIAAYHQTSIFVEQCYFDHASVLDRYSQGSISLKVINSIFTNTGQFDALTNFIETREGSGVTNIVIVSNTLYTGQTGINLINIHQGKILNNIFSSQNDTCINSDGNVGGGGLSIDYNITFASHGGTDFSNVASYIGSHNLRFLNPLLENPAAALFNPIDNSPCFFNAIGHNIDNDVPIDDFNGDVRTLGITTIGALNGVYTPVPLTGNKLFIVQQTKKHVVKRFDTTNPVPAIYDNAFFGIFGTPGSGLTGLNFPQNITMDVGNQIYVCDYENSRVIKLDEFLRFSNQYNTSSTIGKPCAIFYDELNVFLYVLGINFVTISGRDLFMYVGIQKLSTSLTDQGYSNNLFGQLSNFNFKPFWFCRGLDFNEILICGIRNTLYSVLENGSPFSQAVEKQLIVAPFDKVPKRYVGMVMMSDQQAIFLNTGERLAKAVIKGSDLTIINYSDFISKTLYGLSIGLGDSLLIYNVETMSILRYDLNLNFIETVFTDSGSTITTDLKYVSGLLEKNFS